IGSPKVFLEPTSKILYLSDYFNHRVLVLPTVPTSPTQKPTIVLGQATFFSSAFGVSATTLHFPRGLFATTTELYLADGNNNRIAIWNFPLTINKPIDTILGQALPNIGGIN